MDVANRTSFRTQFATSIWNYCCGIPRDLFDDEVPYGTVLNHEYLITEPKDIDKVKVSIVLPDDGKLKYELHKKTACKFLLSTVCKTVGLPPDQMKFFGLFCVRFWDPMSALEDLVRCRRALSARLQFKYYPREPSLIKHYVTKHLLYLQIKYDIRTGRLKCPLKSEFLLASFAIQADEGDLKESSNVDYSSYLKNPELLEDLKTLHERHSGLTQVQAEAEYLDLARLQPTYGLHTLPIIVLEFSPVFRVGLGPWGLAIYSNNLLLEQCWAEFSLWSKGNKIFIKTRQRLIKCLASNPEQAKLISDFYSELSDFYNHSDPQIYQGQRKELSGSELNVRPELVLRDK